MAYGSDRLPSRFPVGTKFVIEGKRGREGQVQVFSRYLEFPDGTFFPAAGPARQAQIAAEQDDGRGACGRVATDPAVGQRPTRLAGSWARSLAGCTGRPDTLRHDVVGHWPSPAINRRSRHAKTPASGGLGLKGDRSIAFFAYLHFAT